ncbi:hypothetical protein BRDCF_p1885 [Bacteroidales bacterium CF]|jgi:hypothetical protein|nr:hypothetical protein BRDCF_p1885 [Bacteroidales bacterium CF]NCB97671.1 hypothetical protein [Bacteroidia bacterium]
MKIRRVVVTVFSLIIWSLSYGQEWSLKDIGIGILDTSEYDKELRIVKKGIKWSEKELYNIRLSPGTEKVFATWVAGPPTKDFLNANGLPVWLCEYVITYPDKRVEKFGPFGFYEAGFSTMIINPSYKMLGKWKIEYFIVNRDTNDRRLIGTSFFTLFE